MSTMKDQMKAANRMKVAERTPVEPEPSSFSSLSSTLSMLKRRAAMIIAGGVIGVATGFLALSLIGNSYTSEASIRLNFTREDTPNATASQQVATMDAMALVNGAVRSLNSRTTANAIVQRYGLDKPPEGEKPGFISSLVSSIKARLSFGAPARSRQDIMTDTLLGNVRVMNEPRSYLITVAYTAASAEFSADMANAFVSEYIRGQRLTELSDARAAAGRDLLNLSGVFGTKHPNYTRAEARVKNLEDQIAALKSGTVDPSQILVGGQSLMRADPLLARVSPNPRVVIIVFTGLGLALAAFLALLLELQSNHLVARLMNVVVRENMASGKQ